MNSSTIHLNNNGAGCADDAVNSKELKSKSELRDDSAVDRRLRSIQAPLPPADRPLSFQEQIHQIRNEAMKEREASIAHNNSSSSNANTTNGQTCSKVNPQQNIEVIDLDPPPSVNLLHIPLPIDISEIQLPDDHKIKKSSADIIPPVKGNFE